MLSPILIDVVRNTVGEMWLIEHDNTLSVDDRALLNLETVDEAMNP